jgi:hypothetical protein
MLYPSSGTALARDRLSSGLGGTIPMRLKTREMAGSPAPGDKLSPNPTLVLSEIDVLGSIQKEW